MNTLDENIEKKKTNYASTAKIVLVGVIVPIILTVILYYHHFGWQFDSKVLEVSYSDKKFFLNEIFYVIIYFIFLLIYFFTFSFIIFKKKPQKYFNTLFIILSLFVVFNSFFATDFGAMIIPRLGIDYPENWRELPNWEELNPVVLTKHLFDAKAIITFIFWFGVFVLGYLFFQNKKPKKRNNN